MAAGSEGLESSERSCVVVTSASGAPVEQDFKNSNVFLLKKTGLRGSASNAAVFVDMDSNGS